MQNIRNIKKLAKILGYTPSEMKSVLDNSRGLIYHKVDKGLRLSSDEIARYLYNNLKDIFEERRIQYIEDAKKEGILPYGKKNKDKIIGLYKRGKDGKPFGYKAIHNLLISECRGDKKLEKEVISASTIRTYLHERWSVSQNWRHRTPYQAIRKRKKHTD